MIVIFENVAKEANTHDIAPTEEYTLHRILLGVPEGTQDLTPVHAFPMESNLDVMGGREFFPQYHSHMINHSCYVQWILGKAVMWGKN